MMKKLLCLLIGLPLYLQANATDINLQLPTWAYAQNPKNNLAVPDDNSIRQVPNSGRTYFYAQVKDLFFAPDWHPEDHPPMPAIVEHGQKPNVYACGFCHRADGPGGPENASLAGLPKAYIVQQMVDFKNGSRKSAVANRAPFINMQFVAQHISDQDIDAAADYFSNLKPRKNIKVLETRRVPETFERGWHLAKSNSNQTEPLGARIIEIPEHLDDFISRDSRTHFLAYVPRGSINKGKKLSTQKNHNIACSQCHGEQLQGQNNIPALAGRSPSYIVRQLYDFKFGFRASESGTAMRLIAQQLSDDDIIAVAAYAASLTPK